MNRSRVVVLNKYGFLNYFIKNKILIILTLFFVCGLISGVFLINKSPLTENFINHYFNSFLKIRTEHNFFYIFFWSFLSSVLYIFFLFLSGTSLIGVVLSPALVFLRGYFYGAFLSNLYSIQALKGIAFNAIIIIPSNIFFLICLILSSRESLSFSQELAKLTLYKSYSSVNIFDYFKNYCGRYFVLLFLIIISALVDATFSHFFINFFKF